MGEPKGGREEGGGGGQENRAMGIPAPEIKLSLEPLLTFSGSGTLPVASGGQAGISREVAEEQPELPSEKARGPFIL